VLAAEHALEVHVVERFLDRSQGFLGFGGRIGIAFSGELQIELRLVDRFLLLAPRRERRVQQSPFAQQRLRRLGVVPEVRFARQDVELLNACLTFGEVKDTSRTWPAVLRGLWRGSSAR